MNAIPYAEPLSDREALDIVQAELEASARVESRLRLAIRAAGLSAIEWHTAARKMLALRAERDRIVEGMMR